MIFSVLFLRNLILRLLCFSKKNHFFSGYACGVVSIYLVANKVDDTEHRVITTQEGIDLAAKIESSCQVQVEYFETSVKENVNVNEMVTKMVKACLEAELARGATKAEEGNTNHSM